MIINVQNADKNHANAHSKSLMEGEFFYNQNTAKFKAELVYAF